MFWDRFETFVFAHLAETIMVLAIMGLVLLVTDIICVAKVQSLRKRYRKLMLGNDSLNLEGLLNQYGDFISCGTAKQHQLESRVEDLEKKLQLSLAGVGLVRYNAFQETGSELSFSLALLDRKQDGVVITSIYGREESRCYGKQIRRGKSTQHLSEEEALSLAEAIQRMGANRKKRRTTRS